MEIPIFDSMEVLAHYNIDGYPFVVERISGSPRLVVEENATTFDGCPAYHLNALLSVIRSNYDDGKAFEQLADGIPIQDQWGGIFPYSDQNADKISEFRRLFGLENGFLPTTAIWVIGSSSDDCVFIPFETLTKILEMKRKIEM